MRRLAIRHGLLGTALLATLLSPNQASSMAILQSTWEEAGGTEDDPNAGFSRNMELAAQDPFTSTVKIVIGDGDSHGTGVFVGKDDEGRDLVLTAAHVVQDASNKPSMAREADEISVESSTGTSYDVAAVRIDPDFFQIGLSHDIAVLTLAESDEPSLDETRSDEPRLFCGSELPDEPATIVGYGSLGTGTVGVEAEWDDPERPVAIHNKIDGRSVDPAQQAAYEFDPSTGEPVEPAGELYNPGTGDMLLMDFDSEDGEHNGLASGATTDLRLFGKTFESDPKPVDEYEGTTTPGDSGAPVFIRVGGRWAIIGVVSFGNEDAHYGNVQNIADPYRAFINANFPTIAAVDNDGKDKCP